VTGLFAARLLLLAALAAAVAALAWTAFREKQRKD
jgi:hypothetical protein